MIPPGPNLSGSRRVVNMRGWSCPALVEMSIAVVALLSSCPAGRAEAVFFPALNGAEDARILTVYSSLDTPLARPMIEGFRQANPDVAVRYEELLTSDIYDRIVAETDAGKPTADMAFSSACELQTSSDFSYFFCWPF